MTRPEISSSSSSCCCCCFSQVRMSSCWLCPIHCFVLRRVFRTNLCHYYVVSWNAYVHVRTYVQGTRNKIWQKYFRNRDYPTTTYYYYCHFSHQLTKFESDTHTPICSNFLVKKWISSFLLFHLCTFFSLLLTYVRIYPISPDRCWA